MDAFQRPLTHTKTALTVGALVVGLVTGLSQLIGPPSLAITLVGYGVLIVTVCALAWELHSTRGIVDAEYLGDTAEVKNRANQLLQASKTTFHYYGAVGFLGEEEDPGTGSWTDALTAKMRDDDFYVYRYVDLREVSEWQTILKHAGEVQKEIGQYVRWLERQSDFVSEDARSGALMYDFPGAPAWKWGVHVLVFDIRWIMVVVRKGMRHKRAIVMERPEAAKAFVGALDEMAKTLGCTPLTREDLARMRGVSPDADLAVAGDAGPR